jgi:dolichol-phosphate mannosyltransferase
VGAPAWVILPTYQEAASLAHTVHAVRAALPGAHLLVVDDASPDGTAALASGLGVDVLERRGPRGLGDACRAGLVHALAQRAPYVLQMDADGSHHAEDLPALLAAAREGADLAVGSRYVPGGASEHSGALRRALSRGACGYARRVLGVGVRDLTTGLKCFRADALRRIDPATTRSRGYAIHVELTYRALAAGLRVVELPIRFTERRAGRSKLSGRIVLEAAWRVPALRLRPPALAADARGVRPGPAS